MLTIKDVAKESGASVGTVSRFLNGAQLKKSNMEKIEAAIKKLGYVQNPIAKSMKTGKSMTIAVLVPRLANMFSMRVIESIERKLSDYGYSVIISDSSDNEIRQIEKLAMLKNKLVDGFVLMPVGTCSKDIQHTVNGIPLVLIDRVIDENIFDSVVVNNRQVSYNAVKKILDCGVRRIGIIEGPDHISTAIERRNGFEDALLEKGLKKQFFTKGGYTFEDGRSAMRELMKHNLEAVFISNYELTVGALSVLPPQKQIQIIGFDTPEFYQGENFTFITQPIEEIGEKAAQILLERIENPNKKIESVLIDCQF